LVAELQSLTVLSDDADPSSLPCYKKATAGDVQSLIKSMTKGALNRRNGKGRLILLESSKPSRRTVKATPDETAPDAAANLAAL
jgi:hypothetical protein